MQVQTFKAVFLKTCKMSLGTYNNLHEPLFRYFILVFYVLCVVLCVLCMGHLVIVPFNLACLHSFFEHLFNLYSKSDVEIYNKRHNCQQATKQTYYEEKLIFSRPSFARADLVLPSKNLKIHKWTVGIGK